MASADNRIDSMENIASFLESEGYEFQEGDETLRVKIGGSEHPFVAVITRTETGNALKITCQIAKLGMIEEEKIPQVFAACLDANTRILPYAFGLMTASDNPELDDEKEWPLVLIDSIPLGDLSREEFISSLESLWMALEASREVLSNALNA